MIAKRIGRRFKVHSTDHGLQARITYICGKADTVLTPSIPGGHQMAARQMEATCCLHRRDPQRAFVHIMVSWPSHEQPSDTQMLDAAQMILSQLGATGHEAVIGTHRDTPCTHFHMALSRVHPVTGALLDLWQDYARLEKASRVIEIQQGWSHDKGRFAMRLDTTASDGVVLVPVPVEAWHEKRIRRATRRTVIQADYDRARAGLPPLHQRLPQAAMRMLLDKLERSTDWAAVQGALGRLGLEYRRVARGAVIALRGTAEAVAASRFAPWLSWSHMRARLGAPPDSPPEAILPDMAKPSLSFRGLSCRAAQLHQRFSRDGRWGFSRLHAALFGDEDLGRHVTGCELVASRQVVTLQGGGWVRGDGAHISIGGGGSVPCQLRIAVMLAQAKGWSELDISGAGPLHEALMRIAARNGMRLSTTPDHMQIELAVLRRKAKDPGLFGMTARMSQFLETRDHNARRNAIDTDKRSAARGDAFQRIDTSLARIDPDLGDLEPSLRSGLQRLTRTIWRQTVVQETDLRAVSVPLTSIDHLPDLRATLHDQRHAPARIDDPCFTLSSARLLHKQMEISGKRVFEDVLSPLPGSWLLAHRDTRGMVCGYEWAIMEGEARRSGMVGSSIRTFGRLPDLTDIKPPAVTPVEPSPQDP